MVFNLKKNLYKSDDFLIKAVGGDFFFRISMFKKGFYLYNTAGEQVGQILFEKNKAIIVASESSSAVVFINELGKIFIEKNSSFADKKFMPDRKLEKIHTQNNFIFGMPQDYKYDIYEKEMGDKTPDIVANIIPNIYNKDYYKVKINGGKNILKLIMIIIAVDKLCKDPYGKY